MWTAAVCPGSPECMAMAAHVLTHPLLTDLRNVESMREAEAGAPGRPHFPPLFTSCSTRELEAGGGQVHA